MFFTFLKLYEWCQIAQRFSHQDDANQNIQVCHSNSDFSINPCILYVARRFGRRLQPILRQFVNLINHNKIQWYSRWNTSNYMLSEEKKNKKLINTNVIIRHNAIVVSCNGQLWRSRSSNKVGLLHTSLYRCFRMYSDWTKFQSWLS